jgi:transposase
MRTMKKYTSQKKAAIVLAVLKGEKINEVASYHQIDPKLIGKWKRVVETGLADMFSDKRHKENQTRERLLEELYKTIGQREVEINWLKKKLNLELPPEIRFDR